jgi:hypothetical protein
MNARWLTGRTFRVLFAPLMLAGALIAAAPGGASASTCVGWTGVQPPNPGSSRNFLTGVAVLSRCNAWAVGDYNGTTFEQTLIEHWNGSAWKQVPSPNPGSGSVLTGVAATSASNAWAVGNYGNGTGGSQTLIAHWNGTTWKQVPSPNPAGTAGFNILTGVAATSASNAWAVGTTAGQTLIAHWNGTAWKQVPSPNPDIDSRLTGVAATSASNAWAVGRYNNGDPSADKTLIAHWNGTAWKQVPSPNPSVGVNILTGVAATSASNAWAVGYGSIAMSDQTLIAHWNGTAWKQVPSPNPGGPDNDNDLNGVVATSAGNAWVVGGYTSALGLSTLTAHWNGTAWKQVPSPNLGIDNDLIGVAASSATDIWAVGHYVHGTVFRTLALHCC